MKFKRLVTAGSIGTLAIPTKTLARFLDCFSPKALPPA
jgi:hypothetical protein